MLENWSKETGTELTLSVGLAIAHFMDLLHDRDDATFGFDDRFLRAAEIEHRTHAGIDSESGAAEDSQLFTTAALALTHLPRYRVRDDPLAGDFVAVINLQPS